MKKLFENWRKHLNEAAVPHSADHIVKKMKKTGKSAMETLKSLTTDLSDEEAKRWLERHKDEMESAKQDLDEAAVECTKAKRAGAQEAQRPTVREKNPYSRVTRLSSIPDRKEPSMNRAIDSIVGGSPSIDPRSMIHAPSSTINSSISWLSCMLKL